MSCCSMRPEDRGPAARSTQPPRRKVKSRSALPFANSSSLLIVDETFAKWLDWTIEVPETDRDAEVISGKLWTLVQASRLSIRRGDYIVRWARKRFTVEPGEA